MVVTFCGNRIINEKEVVLKNLYVTIKDLIEKGAMEFLLGGYGEFDNLAALTVNELKKEYPLIKCVIILPYLKRKYNEFLYDYSEYPELERVPQKLAIVKRNEYIVNRSDVVVSYVRYTYGGSFKTLQYAKRKKKQIIDLNNLSCLTEE